MLRHRLRKVAPTSIAASVIDGLTVHSFLNKVCFNERKKNQSCNQNSMKSIEEDWHDVDYLFIDVSLYRILKILLTLWISGDVNGWFIHAE